MSNRLTLAAVAVLAALSLVGIVLLTALQLPVPEVLGYVVTACLAGLTGAAVPLAKRPSSTGGDDDQGDELGADAVAMVSADERRNLPRHLTRTDTGSAIHPRPAAA